MDFSLRFKKGKKCQQHVEQMGFFWENICRTCNWQISAKICVGHFFRGNVNYFAKTFQQTEIFRLFYRKCKCFVVFFSDDAKTKIFGQATFREF